MKRLEGTASRHLAAALLVCAVGAGGTGCIAAGASVGAATAVGTAYFRGEHKSVETAPVYRVWLATLVALDELGLRVERERFQTHRGYAVARREDGKPIKVEVLRQSSRLTQLRIRVGTFGEESLSKLIAERVHAEVSDTVAVSAPPRGGAGSPESAIEKY